MDISFSGTDNLDPDELQFDFLNVAGDAVLEGDLTLTLNGSPEIQDGDEFTLLNANSITGEFENVNIADVPGIRRDHCLQ